jgi:excisionase family DNA binding protein
VSSTDTAVLIDVWPDAGQRIGLGRTKTWELVRTGALETVKVGRRRLVPVAAINEFAERLRAS